MLASSKSADCLAFRFAPAPLRMRLNAPRQVFLCDVFAKSTDEFMPRDSDVILSTHAALQLPTAAAPIASSAFVALHSAIVDGDVDQFEILLQRHRLADGSIPALQARDPLSGKTLTHVAAERHHNGMLDTLLNLGAPKDVCDRRNGRTPLHAALHVEDIEAILVLLRHGANMEVPDFNGYTPLQSAVEDGLYEIEAILRAHGANGCFDTVTCSPRVIGRMSVVRVPSADLILQQRQASLMDEESKQSTQSLHLV